jgi:hypothetical protein
MSIPARFGPKQFSGEYNNVSVEALLHCAYEALAAAPTAAHGQQIALRANWEAWQIYTNANPITLPYAGTLPMPGFEFKAGTKYREVQYGGNRAFRGEGGVQLDCFAGFIDSENVSALSLVFYNSPSQPMWLARTSELVVYHTVQTVAEFLRLRIFGQTAGAVLNLTVGGWANAEFGSFGTHF